MKTRIIGCLPYLNLTPLIRTLQQETPEGYTLVYDTPSGLASLLRQGKCDVAAVSSFEALSNPDLEIVPGLSISADGPVLSVLLFSNIPPAEIRTVALDTSSLSGAALTRIILADGFGVSPDFVRLPPEPEKMRTAADAWLLIGNNAMLAPEAPYVLDLSEEWKKLTGLPFVFGVWAARKGAINADDVALLQQAKQMGMRDLNAIVAEQSQKLRLPENLVRSYLAEIMVYDLTDRELAGLELFRQKCVTQHLLDSQSAIRLLEAPAITVR